MTMVLITLPMQQKYPWTEKPPRWFGLLSPDLSVTEALRDHLDREQSQRQPTSKEGLSMSFKKPGEIILKTDYYKKAHLREFRLR